MKKVLRSSLVGVADEKASKCELFKCLLPLFKRKPLSFLALVCYDKQVNNIS